MVAASSRVLHLNLPEKLFCGQLFADCQCCSQNSLGWKIPLNVILSMALQWVRTSSINLGMSDLISGQSPGSQCVSHEDYSPTMLFAHHLTTQQLAEEMAVVSHGAEQPQAHNNHVFQLGLCIQLI